MSLDVQVLGVQRVLAVIAVPEEAVLLFGPALALDDEPDSVRRTLRRMRHARRQQQHFALMDRNVDAAAVLHGPQRHRAFELIEELLARILVVVAAHVRAADHHDDELGMLEYAPVAHRRFEKLAMLFDPLLQVECFERVHDASPAAPTCWRGERVSVDSPRSIDGRRALALAEIRDAVA